MQTEQSQRGIYLRQQLEDKLIEHKQYPQRQNAVGLRHGRVRVDDLGHRFLQRQRLGGPSLQSL